MKSVTQQIEFYFITEEQQTEDNRFSGVFCCKSKSASFMKQCFVIVIVHSFNHLEIWNSFKTNLFIYIFFSLKVYLSNTSGFIKVCSQLVTPIPLKCKLVLCKQKYAYCFKFRHFSGKK